MSFSNVTHVNVANVNTPTEVYLHRCETLSKINLSDRLAKVKPFTKRNLSDQLANVKPVPQKKPI